MDLVGRCLGKSTQSIKIYLPVVDLTGMRSPEQRLHERGASAVEYALLVALICVASLGAINFLTNQSGEALSSTSSNIGEPIDPRGSLLNP